MSLIGDRGEWTRSLEAFAELVRVVGPLTNGHCPSWAARLLGDPLYTQGDRRGAVPTVAPGALPRPVQAAPQFIRSAKCWGAVQKISPPSAPPRGWGSLPGGAAPNHMPLKNRSPTERNRGRGTGGRTRFAVRAGRSEDPASLEWLSLSHISIAYPADRGTSITSEGQKALSSHEREESAQEAAEPEVRAGESPRLLSKAWARSSMPGLREVP